MIVLPGRQYFEFLASDDQLFSLTCSYEDYYNTLKFTGSDENSAFIEYQKKWSALQQQAMGISKRLQTNKQNSDSVKHLTEKQKKQEEYMKSYLRNIIDANGNNLLSVLVKSMLPIEVPDFKIPTGTHNPDSVSWLRKYNYNKDHFFDNIDLTDERLLRTPILFARLNAFFTNAVMVKLADDIYLSGKADWTTKEFRDDLSRQVELLRNNLIGLKAKDLVMNSYKGTFVSLYDIEKDFTILYFWEPNCGHCKEATPKLKAYYEKARNEGVEVFAVCTVDDKPAWTKYIEENGLTWINGWDPERKTYFDFYYNIQSTPMIYILDRDKKIIAKKLSVDDIPSFIDNYRKYNM
jgi:thiol-disulfide isomerase/thioredoxin